ncbi:hypothetical protein IQ266_26060 [filamentous cyanobacterium LEGE 11480]|uniref:Uncharacterized protein n=1 Tax=Romeriopsis navalis LEGE 11480 TaxID=2777977 RepID=A0A928VV83_9CYAN|nr:hypothetical protein [Romeriopsis navalis]MBE9033205.1 hypothetical protein [Romeriopsis navalis LEGE 11480]
MELEISPYVGAGAIRFGMSRTEVARAFPGKLRDASSDVGIWDTSADGNFQIAYTDTSPHSCTTLMIAAPQPLHFHGKNLFDGSSIRELTFWLHGLDQNIDLRLDGVVSYKYGICLQSDDLQCFADASLDSVVLFAKTHHADIPTDENFSRQMTWSQFLALPSTSDVNR